MADGLIPEGMDPKRYRELLTIINKGEALNNPEIQQIQDHWKEYASKKTWGKPKEPKVTSQDVARETIKKSAEDLGIKKAPTPKQPIKGVIRKVGAAVDNPVPGGTALQNNIIRNAPKVMKGAALFIGTTSLLSSAMKMSDKAEANAQVREMNKKAKKKVEEEKQKRKDHQIQDSAGHIDTSEIVMEMFEQRIGHYKMGNNRF